MAKRKRGGNKKGSQAEPSSEQQHRRHDVNNENIKDDDDEEIDEDEAFNSDDERKYGHFFEKDDGDDNDDDSADEDISVDDNDNDDDDSDSDDNDNDSEEGGDGGQYMLDLLHRLDEPQDNKSGRKENSGAAVASQVAESEFASSVVRKGNLTLDSLMQGLHDTKGFGVMQKAMRTVAEGEATQAPVAKVVSKRAERKVHYEHQAQEVSLWLDAVQQNRQAETLDFRPKEHLKVTRDTLVDKFVPTTDFEKQLHDALQEAGQQDEEAILKAEEEAFLAQHQDDLGGHEQTLEEFKKRRGQLAKLRALMFYHEQKRHRINKIKSKKYRRIRKKQRERAKEAEVEAQAQEDPDLLKDLEEKEELARMRERMTLAHKNTSKWAKRILKRGKNVDTDTRKALSAQIKRGDDLRKKMQGQADSDDEQSESEDLVESARKVLEDVEEEGKDPIQGKGLFKLAFMQRGIEKQREKAKEEARELLRELESNERNLDDYDQAIRYDSEEEEERKKKRVKVASKENMKSVIDEGALVATSLKFGNSNSIAMSGGITIEVGTPKDAIVGQSGSEETHGNAISEYTATVDVARKDDEPPDNTERNKKGFKKKSLSKKKRKEESKELDDAEEANPWISSSRTHAMAVDGKEGAVAHEKNRKTAPSKTGVVDVDGVLDILDGGPKVPNKIAQKDDKNENNKDSGKDKKIASLSQEELIRRAFATQDEKEIEEDFAIEKEEVANEEDDIKTKSRAKKEKDFATVSGWGAWTGAGTEHLKKSARELPPHLQPPPKKEPKRKRQDAKRVNVIIREKRIKRTADKFMMKAVPYPYKSREEYERAMRGAVGREWNVSQSVKEMTRPEIQTRAGKVIQPLSLTVKQKRVPERAPAKF